MADFKLGRIKFKWRGGELVDKKLYTFVVLDFERIT